MKPEDLLCGIFKKEKFKKWEKEKYSKLSENDLISSYLSYLFSSIKKTFLVDYGIISYENKKYFVWSCDQILISLNGDEKELLGLFKKRSSGDGICKLCGHLSYIRFSLVKLRDIDGIEKLEKIITEVKEKDNFCEKCINKHLKPFLENPKYIGFDNSILLDRGLTLENTESEFNKLLFGHIFELLGKNNLEIWGGYGLIPNSLVTEMPIKISKPDTEKTGEYDIILLIKENSKYKIIIIENKFRKSDLKREIEKTIKKHFFLNSYLKEFCNEKDFKIITIFFNPYDNYVKNKEIYDNSGIKPYLLDKMFKLKKFIISGSNIPCDKNKFQEYFSNDPKAIKKDIILHIEKIKENIL